MLEAIAFAVVVAIASVAATGAAGASNGANVIPLLTRTRPIQGFEVVLKV